MKNASHWRGRLTDGGRPVGGGEGRNPHYQLMVKTPQVRFSAVRKMFPRAHVEAAREPSALKRYVGKVESRVGALPTSQEMYPSLSKFWDLIITELNSWRSGTYMFTNGAGMRMTTHYSRGFLLYVQICGAMKWRTGGVRQPSKR